jgi:hypothetical protein
MEARALLGSFWNNERLGQCSFQRDAGKKVGWALGNAILHEHAKQLPGLPLAELMGSPQIARASFRNFKASLAQLGAQRVGGASAAPKRLLLQLNTNGERHKLLQSQVEKQFANGRQWHVKEPISEEVITQAVQQTWAYAHAERVTAQQYWASDHPWPLTRAWLALQNE